MKKAFTLAEVLITLGIIGVVAALTLPNLIANYKKKVYVEGLKSGYSLVSNAFKAMMANDGVDNLLDSELFHNSDVPTEQELKDVLSKYLKIVNVISKRESHWGPTFLLSNGMAIDVLASVDFGGAGGEHPKALSYGGKMTMRNGLLVLDVNGEKGPNEDGRDRFNFYITQAGIVPWGGRDEIMFSEARSNASQESVDERIKSEQRNNYGCNPESDSKAGCAARIMEIDNWQMKY